LRLDPEQAAAHAGLSGISVYLYTLGIDESASRLENALERARRGVDLAPRNARVRTAYARALAASDRLTAALEEARAAVDLDPDLAAAHAVLGSIHRLREENEEALESSERAAALEPDSPGVLTSLAHTFREMERYSEAMELFGQAIDLDHEAIVPQLGAAGTLHLAGHLSRALRIYRRLLEDWDYARDRVLLGVGGVFVAGHDYEQALETYTPIEIPENGSLPSLLALYGKGYCLLKLGREAEAEYFLSSLIERVPADYDGPARGREFLFRAYDDLISFFRERGRDRKVESLLREACDRPLAPTHLARSLADTLGDRKAEAVAVLARALLGSDPLEDPLELGETAIQLARLSTAGGKRHLPRDSEAPRALQLTAERVADSPLGIAHYRLARAQALIRDVEAAVSSLERARRHGYLPADLLQSESDFNPIRDDAAFRALIEP
jgi:tetratricopeptide (TPR) repeat protein